MTAILFHFQTDFSVNFIKKRRVKRNKIMYNIESSRNPKLIPVIIPPKAESETKNCQAIFFLTKKPMHNKMANTKGTTEKSLKWDKYSK